MTKIQKPRSRWGGARLVLLGHPAAIGRRRHPPATLVPRHRRRRSIISMIGHRHPRSICCPAAQFYSPPNSSRKSTNTFRTSRRMLAAIGAVLSAPVRRRRLKSRIVYPPKITSPATAQITFARHRRRRPLPLTPSGLPGEGCAQFLPRSSGASSCPRTSRRRSWFRMRCAVRVALERDRGHGDDGAAREPLLQFRAVGFAFGEPESPAVVVDHDRDVVRIVEGRGAALEGCVVEVPPRRGGPPDQLRELAPVSLVAGAAALGREVVLIPPLQLGFGRQRQFPAAWLPIR